MTLAKRTIYVTEAGTECSEAHEAAEQQISEWLLDLNIATRVQVTKTMAESPSKFIEMLNIILRHGVRDGGAISKQEEIEGSPREMPEEPPAG